jgi:hypothetical protein
MVCKGMPAGFNEQKELAMLESRGQSIRIDGWQARSKAQPAVHPVKLNSSHFKLKQVMLTLICIIAVTTAFNLTVNK